MRQSLGLALVVLVVLVAGCTGGDAGPTTSPSPSTATAGGAPTQATSVETPNGSLIVHYINVGQSDATLIVGPTGETMLIDTGHFTDDGETVLAYLKAHDINRIDHLITTHNDADHIGGHAAVIEYYETEGDGIGAVYDPGIAASTQTYNEYLDAVENHDVDLFRTLAGDEIAFEGATVQVLGPPEEYLDNRARNENNIVLKVTHGETSFLFTGDAEDDQEAHLVATYGEELRADVLKASHHGSRSSSQPAFLDSVDPQAVIISSAYDSRYGHPHEEILQRYADRSLPTYWTAVHGDVVLVSDGTTISIRTQAEATTDPLGLRDAQAVDPGSTAPLVERAQITGGGVDPVDGATTTVADGGPQIAITAINADAQGDDRENLNDEYIVLTNEGDQAVDLSGWTISDDAGHTYTVPAGTTLDPGSSVTLHTGSGTDTATELYWGRGSPVWNNDGDTVIVRDANGDLVVREAY